MPGIGGKFKRHNFVGWHDGTYLDGLRLLQTKCGGKVVTTLCIHGKLSMEDLHIYEMRKYRDAENTGCVKHCQLPQGVAYKQVPRLQAVCPMAI